MVYLCRLYREMSDFTPMSIRVAARHKMAYFSEGDYVLFGKFKNKAAILKRMYLDERGVPMIEVQPVPQGRKKNRIMGLYNIRKMTPEQIQKMESAL